MKHYVCKGDCEGESKTPGVCEADLCDKKGESLIACECDDGLHEDAEEVSDLE